MESACLKTMEIINELFRPFILREKSLYIKKEVCAKRGQADSVAVALEKLYGYRHNV